MLGDGHSRNLLASFGRFASANDNDNISRVEPHPLNVERMQQWKSLFLQRLQERQLNGLDSVENATKLTKWTLDFVSKIQYVPFAEFRQRVEKCAQEVVERVKKAAPEAVILMIGGGVRKSSLWVTILVWKYLKEVVTHIFNEFDFKTMKGNYWTIMCDDASYSGIQYRQDAWLGFSNRTHLCLVPYVSKKAIKAWTDVNQNAVILDSSIHFSNTTTLANHDFGKFWEVFLRTTSDRSALYLDHKLPDNVSIYTQIMAHGPIPPGDSDDIERVVLLGGFIEGCSYTKYEQENYKIRDLLSKFDASATANSCPNPIYKTIKYVDPDSNTDLPRYASMILQYLDRYKIDCSVCGRMASFVSTENTHLYCSTACNNLLKY